MVRAVGFEPTLCLTPNQVENQTLLRPDENGCQGWTRTNDGFIMRADLQSAAIAAMRPGIKENQLADSPQESNLNNMPPVATWRP